MEFSSSFLEELLSEKPLRASAGQRNSILARWEAIFTRCIIYLFTGFWTEGVVMTPFQIGFSQQTFRYIKNHKNEKRIIEKTEHIKRYNILIFVV